MDMRITSNRINTYDLSPPADLPDDETLERARGGRGETDDEERRDEFNLEVQPGHQEH